MKNLSTRKCRFLCVCPKASAGVTDFLKNRSDTCPLLSLGSVPAIIILVYCDFYGRKAHSTVSQCTSRFPSMWVVLLYGRTLSNDGPSFLGSLYCQRGKLYGYVPRLWALEEQRLRCGGRQSLSLTVYPPCSSSVPSSGPTSKLRSFLPSARLADSSSQVLSFNHHPHHQLPESV